jgi:endogenous inhibitor of DNA gyrase (YacG/DUF329 family)
MTGREQINKQIQKRRKFYLMLNLFLALGCISMYFVSSEKDEILSPLIILGLLLAGCFSLYILFQIFFVTCPFCQKKIPWTPDKIGMDRMSDHYCYCPFCGKELNKEIQINSEQKRC